MCAKLLQSHLTLCDPMDCSLPAPLSMGFSRQEYWSELPCPPPRDLPDPRTQVSCVSCIGSRFFTTSTTWEAPQTVYLLANKLSKTELLNSEENIGFQTTFSLDILEDPKFLGVQIAWLQKEWESWTYLPGTSTYLPDIRDNRRPAGKVVSLTCLYPYFRKEDKYLADTAYWAGSLSETLEEKLLLLVHWLLQQLGQENRHFHEPHGLDSKEATCKAEDLGSISGLGRSPGGGHGNPLQYSCLEHPHRQRNLVGYGPWGHKESLWPRFSVFCRFTGSRKLTHSLLLETLCTRQQKRHWCIEQSYGLCGRGRGWEDLGEWHWNM